MRFGFCKRLALHGRSDLLELRGVSRLLRLQRLDALVHLTELLRTHLQLCRQLVRQGLALAAVPTAARQCGFEQVTAVAAG